MQRYQIQEIITKYRKLAGTSYDEENKYERFADFIEDNIEIYEDDEDGEYCDTEKNLLERFKEAEDEIDAQWAAMFPEGDDDDAITDYLTR